MREKKKYTPVRFSHITSYAGVGSIVRDSNDFTMAVTDIRYWKDSGARDITEPIVLVGRVKAHLKTTKDLRTPPIAKVNMNDRKGVVGSPIPAIIFPGFAQCKVCNRLHHKPWGGVDNQISKDLICDNCFKPALEQVTWCAVSSSGDLKDVPWHDICHRDGGGRCEEDYSKSYLEIVPGDKGKKIVRCTRPHCNSSNVFEQSNTKFNGSFQPWENDLTTSSGPKLFTVMEVNDPRAYMSKKKRAIALPPETNIDKDSLVYKLCCNSVKVKEIQSETRPLKKKRLLIGVANEYRCSVEDVQQALSSIELDEIESVRIDAGEMLSDEYKALMTITEYKETSDFIATHKTESWRAYLEDVNLDERGRSVANIVGDIVAVERLRVIEVFNGFSRVANEPEGSEVVVDVVPPDITGELDWLPAIELFGEGIFFTIKQSVLEEWEGLHDVRTRAREVLRRYEESNEGPFENLNTVNPRFMLLHTISHLIIRELEISAGYPSASLKERIYSSESEEMAGILIYTAVPDIAGSLGGIVESAEPINFLKLLDGAFKHAEWCSLDPVCTEHEGQGPSWLNRAACHACSLVPETSCEYGNVFLDRVFIKGNKRKNIPSIVDFGRAC